MPGIAPLLRPGSPANFARAVAAVVIRPVQGHAGRAGTDRGLDVSHEQADIMPSFADRDATSSVILELLMFWVMAPGYHAGPGLVQRMSAQAVLRRSFPDDRCRDLPVQAPARPGGLIPVKEVGEPDFVCRSAIALEISPANKMPGGRPAELTEHYPAPESLTKPDFQFPQRPPHGIGEHSCSFRPHVAGTAQLPGKRIARTSRCRALHSLSIPVPYTRKYPFLTTALDEIVARY